MRRGTEAAAVLGGLLAVAIAATYPLILHPATRLPNDLGDPVLISWILWWDATALRHGLHHLWDAPVYFPYRNTLAFSEHMLGLAIFTAPLQWLTSNAVLVYNMAFLASYVNAGAGMYLLARLLTGRSDAAAIAALAYAFSPFRVAQFAHLQWLMNGWVPLSLWALHRYFATRAWRFLAAAASAYALQALTSTYFAYFALLPLGVVALAEIRRRRPQLAITVRHTIAATALAVAALAPVITVYARVRHDNNFRRTSTEIDSYSADVRDYFHGHKASWLWRFGTAGSGEHELFPGAVALVLTAIAVATRRGRASAHTGAYVAIAAIAFVLSLGPHPSAWGHRSPMVGPYKLGLDIIPGLDGVRAPSRLGLMVSLAFAVLAAHGARILFDRIGRRSRVAVIFVGVLVVAESWAAPVRTAEFNPTADREQIAPYEFLRHSSAGAVLELPMADADEGRLMTYQYLTLFHGHPTLNGHSGYDPPLVQLLVARDHAPFAETSGLGAAIDLVRAIGVRYVVVHRGRFADPGIESALLRELETDGPHTVARNDFGQTVVFTLAADNPRPDDANSQPVPTSSIQLKASHSPGRLPLVVDGNRETRWLTGTHQSGNEWIEITLDRPRNVSRVRMQTAERSFGDYPRELTIEAVEPAGTRMLFHGSVLPHFARGFLVDHAYPIIDVALPPNRAHVIRLRQVGVTDELFWSIHELELLERVEDKTRSTDGTR